MKFITENWMLIFVVVAAVFYAVFLFIHFLRLPRAERMQQVKEWLLYATIEAEKELGSGTGELKLRKVYDKFLERFPWLAKMLPFERFADLVKDVLIKTNDLINKNDDVFAYVNGEDEETDVPAAPNTIPIGFESFNEEV